jgi:hypothetical protein
MKLWKRISLNKLLKSDILLNLTRRISPVRKKNIFIQQESNPLVVYRCYGGQIELLTPVESNLHSSLSNNILQEPGFVKVNNQTYDLRKDGVYRFYKLPYFSEQRLVCKNGLESLLLTVGYLFSYGTRDDSENVEKLFTLILKRRAIAGCGVLAKLVHNILSQLNIQSRLAYMMSTDVWGGQDDGHTLLEIKDENNNWFLYDPTFGYCFRFNDRRLSLYEFSTLNKSDLLIWEKLPSNQSYESFSRNGYEYDFWLGLRFLSENAVKNWFARISKLPLLMENNVMHCPQSLVRECDNNRLSKHYQIITDNEFLKRFYQ